ncbi:NAD(P)H-dependent oxidoreductase [Candidatus Nomurabacteria bacterium]|nr:NAD(P)H-dependent oxidoreductase [Candidatus Nomurabacteria bacterium]
MKFFSDHTPRKIFVLVGHPDESATLTAEMALLYETAARKAGHEVRKMHLAKMHFDPILHKGYKAIQQLEPDLKTFQDNIKWADHTVILYPNWWCTMPALLKGLFDRAWLPGFCFNMRKDKQGRLTMGWIKRLKGKSARVIVLSGTHPLLIRLIFGDYTNEIKKGILWFAGFKVKVTRMGPTDTAPEWLKNVWRRKMVRMGTLGE